MAWRDFWVMIVLVNAPGAVMLLYMWLAGPPQF